MSFLGCEVVEVMGGNEISKLLECPVCTGIATPPISNCREGHTVCFECKARVDSCPVCRAKIDAGRNFFMESVVYASTFTCPYVASGCPARLKGDAIKKHASDCDFRPNIRWRYFIPEAFTFPIKDVVLGGMESGIPLQVIRSWHGGSTTPGKLFEFLPDPFCNPCSISWRGHEHFKWNFEVLLAKPGCVEWIYSKDGEEVPGAVQGGVSDEGDEPLYIGRFKVRNFLICGKVQRSLGMAFVAYNGVELCSPIYEILVEKTPEKPTPEKSETPKKS